MTNNLRKQEVVGSRDARGIGAGRFDVTGDLIAYFESSELYDMFLAGTATDLSFDIGGVASKKYNFNMPKIKFESAEVVAGGNDQDVMAKMTFRALYDATEDSTLTITRTP